MMEKQDIKQTFMDQYKILEQNFQIFIKKNEMEQVAEDKKVADA